MTDTPGSSVLTADQQAEMERRYQQRYVAVMDGTHGGPTLFVDVFGTRVANNRANRRKYLKRSR